MKKHPHFLLILISMLLILSKTGDAQTAAWQWAISHGTGDEYVATDANGNIYGAGSFFTGDTFDSLTLTSAGVKDVFVVKYDASSHVKWVRTAGGSDIEGVSAISIGPDGGVYITGVYKSSTIDFGGITLTNSAYFDIFIVKYDSSGNVVWAQSANGNDSDWSNDIAVDGNGNAYITGHYWSATLTFSGVSISNANAFIDDFFLVKYDQFGNFAWVKGGGGMGWDKMTGICVDETDNVYITGMFSSPSIILDTLILPNVGNTSNIFIAKYNSSGDISWAINGGFEVSGEDISYDHSGYLYVTGNFFDSLSLGNINLENITNVGDMFLAKFDSSGNGIWARAASGNSVDYGWYVASDKNGGAYVGGTFYSNSITFDTTVLYNQYPSFTDIFIAKCDSSGNWLWAKSVGGNNYDDLYGLATNSSGDMFISGQSFSSIVSFDSITLDNGMFLAKLNDSQSCFPYFILYADT